jgi:hypothetical protein
MSACRYKGKTSKENKLFSLSYLDVIVNPMYTIYRVDLAV